MPKRKKAAAMPQAVCTCLEPKRAAKAVGTFAALVHLVWAVIIAAGFGQMWADFLIGLHMVSASVTVGAFNALTAAEMIVVTFILGALAGWAFASVWNWAAKCACR
ncbi:MAG: hypothetical protein QXD77_01545 [Candidatus Aenigmatarchaeota archaeon]